MNKRTSPTVVGVFVVASFAILIVALVVVGSGKMFRKPVRFVCMFPGNLNGLKVGALVKVRGVQIGEVAAIRLRLDQSEGQIRSDFKGFRLPVIIDLDPTMLRERERPTHSMNAASKTGSNAGCAPNSKLKVC